MLDQILTHPRNCPGVAVSGGAWTSRSDRPINPGWPSLSPTSRRRAVKCAVRGVSTRANPHSCCGRGTATTASRTAHETCKRSGGYAGSCRSALAPFARLTSIDFPIPAPLLSKLFSSTTAHATEPAASDIRMTLPIILIASTLLAHAAGLVVTPILRNRAAAARVGLAAMFCCTATIYSNSMRDDVV